MTLPATREPRAALVAWRQSTGYSQSEVGALFRVSKQAIGNWETGRARVPARVRARLLTEGWLHSLCMRWTPEHDAWLRAHAGHWPIRELATRLGAAFGIPRTPPAVQTRMQRLGVSSRTPQLLTRAQIAYYCGVTPVTVLRWVRQGWLVVPAWALGIPRGDWAVPPAALETFLDTYAVRLHVAQMPASPYRAQVERQWQRHRWLNLDQIAAHVGVARGTVWNWITGGQLLATRQPQPAGAVRWMVRARDLATFLRAREQRRAA